MLYTRSGLVLYAVMTRPSLRTMLSGDCKSAEGPTKAKTVPLLPATKCVLPSLDSIKEANALED